MPLNREGYLQSVLDRPAVDTIIYFVPNGGYGTTENREEAENWVRSINAQYPDLPPIVLLQRRVQKSPWTVVDTTTTSPL